jgi:hypothetical protein
MPARMPAATASWKGASVSIAGGELKRIIACHRLTARIYADARFARWGARDVRTVALALAAATTTERPRGYQGTWERVCELTGLSRESIWSVIREDLPRWQPAGETWVHAGECEAPMIRRAGPCGQPGPARARVSSTEDGTWRTAWYCRRHEAHAEAARAAERAARAAGLVPEPVPNTGGLLPAYFPGWTWAEAYQRAGGQRWRPPAAGISADLWPAAAPARRLEVIDGGGERGGGDGLPVLTLLTSSQG